MTTVAVRSGYSPGVIGRVVEMHGRYYSGASGFGQFFEAKVAAGLAEFTGRLGNPRNGLWSAVSEGEVVGSVAIDGEDLGGTIAHLRWFIVAGSMQGQGVGKRLLAEALGFCDRQGYTEIHLWTFAGLDAAQKLYESQGFVLAEEFAGSQWGSEVMERRFVRFLPR